MTAQSPVVPRRSPLEGVRLRFGGVVASEALKIVTVRSTWWSVGISIALALGMAALLGTTSDPEPSSQAAQASLVVSSSTVHLQFIGLIVAVLGAISIGGEYTTGMIRSTYTAVPQRLPSLIARVAVVALTAFALGVVTVSASFLIVTAFLAPRGIEVSLGDEGVLGALLGGAFYLAVIGAFSVCLGALLRSTAASIGAAAGVLFVLPIVVSIATSLLQSEWLADASRYLLGNLGSVLATIPDGTGLSVPTAVLAALGWVLLVGVPAAILTRTRDV